MQNWPEIKILWKFDQKSKFDEKLTTNEHFYGNTDKLFILLHMNIIYKIKIHLNNTIWRAWNMILEYMKNPKCIGFQKNPQWIGIIGDNKETAYPRAALTAIALVCLFSWVQTILGKNVWKFRDWKKFENFFHFEKLVLIDQINHAFC